MTGTGADKGKGSDSASNGNGREGKRAHATPAGLVKMSATAARDRSPDLDSDGLRLACRVVDAEAAAKKKRLSTSVKLKHVVVKNAGYRGEHVVCDEAGRSCLSTGDGKRKKRGDDSGEGGDKSTDDTTEDDDSTADDDSTDSGVDECAEEAGGNGSGDDRTERGVDGAYITDSDKSGDDSAGPSDGGPGQSGGGARRSGKKASEQTHRGAARGKRKDLPRISYSTGDGVLRAAVLHAVKALGCFKTASVTRRAVDDGEAEVQPVSSEAPAVFVVARRPRRSVTLLLCLARGAWVVSESWLVDSIHARAWQPFELYVPKDFAGVLAARAARGRGESLFKGLRFGSRGILNMDIAHLRELVESTGGRLGSNRDANVVIVGREPGGRVPALFPEAAVMVNQLWLPDCVAQWKELPYDSYLVS